MDENRKTESPLLAQYYEIKAQNPDALLLYRVGDFYETFGEDAVRASKVLGIVLTRRASGGGEYTPLAGVPFHAIDSYLPKLVQAGYKVAVCDQLEDPRLTKKLVKRGVTELVTPGVSYHDNLLRQDENNFLAAIAFGTGTDSGTAGVAFIDISTGTFKVAQGSMEYLDLLLSDMGPKEILVERSFAEGFRARNGGKAFISTMDEWAFAPAACRKKLMQRLAVENLKGFGIENLELGITAAGAALFYLEMTHHTDLGHIRTISRIDIQDFVWMDRFTVRNLEIFASAAGEEGVSLLQVMDRCASPMGSRLLRQWLAMPLKDVERIRYRHNAVEAFLADGERLEKVRDAIGETGDMERIVSKAAAGRIAPRELLQLARGLKAVGNVKSLLERSQLSHLMEETDCCSDLCGLITASILPDTAAQIGKGDVIAPGVSEELDRLREILTGGKDILQKIQDREKEATGIPSLKIGYNNVFGYYIEVRNIHRDKVPEGWVRKQTLVSAERYITQEIKDYEEKILGAGERIVAIEGEIYADIVRHVQELIPMLQRNSSAVAQTDCLSAFASLADEKGYCKPEMDDSLAIDITEGRHPVIETLMQPGEEFVANDLSLDNEENQIMILTGPNMAGKSAYLRQNALIVLMAQVGSFVPAKRARIGIVDKIFTRVGASDNISRGESTFMVEMLETSTILNNLSPRSLVLLDEIGRGTSTFDGMSIAWGIVEYIHGGSAHSKERPKTLFATHYHELNELENLYPRVHNWHISVKEADGKVIFLRKLCKGGVAHSFGIHVAKMAGMPAGAVTAAEAKLRELEENARDASCGGEKPEKAVQLTLYQLDDPLLTDIKNTLKGADINNMTPLDAFDLLRELKRKTGL